MNIIIVSLFRETKGGQDAQPDTFSATECFKQATEVLFQAIECTIEL